MRHAVAILVLSSACVAAPDTDRDEQRVIGGTITPDGAFPAVGALIYPFGAGCTGTLIRADVVLTAAHCVDPDAVGNNLPGFTLVSDTTTGTPPVVAATAAVHHELFDYDAQFPAGLADLHDIGLLFLAEPITAVTPMTMATPEEAAALVAGLDVAIVGYGRISNTSQDRGVKYDAVADLIAFNASELQISAGGGAPQNCQGDSGGPGIADLGAGPRVIGIVSRSAALQNDCDDGGIDTRVDHYQQWIVDHLTMPCMGPTCPDAGVAPDASIEADAAPEPDAGDPGLEDGAAGCCSTGGGDPRSALALTLALLAFRRRRG